MRLHPSLGSQGVSWDVRQTRRFVRSYKKLHDNVAAEVVTAVEAIAQDPDIGEKKKGDLSNPSAPTKTSTGT